MTDIVNLSATAIPPTHVWAVVMCWIGCYVAGRILAGGAR